MEKVLAIVAVLIVIGLIIVFATAKKNKDEAAKKAAYKNPVAPVKKDTGTPVKPEPGKSEQAHEEHKN